MKLINMNIDCLENCFEELDFIDFLNAADSNKRLQHAARFVFVRKYRHFSIHFSKRYYGDGDDKFHFYVTSLSIYDLKIGLQFLRCFGDLFSSIDVSLVNQHLMNYISEYCSNSLRQTTRH